ncbi:hypothetical protein [Capillimicrobium parvum]|uniref:ATP-grasp domain-containing protein n=1 Tax=Capillimicrobium parvum TaxID=2884022 RepID=A0A9E6Y0X5_9ACTN|nr:hypothetical protein [Capillimicrobium parvum]UGS37743.1 hypothetical protein DSM104329_04164 [Capillimicrobium parvum]
MTGPAAPGPVLIGFGESACGVEAAWSLLDAGFSVVVFARAGRRSEARLLRGVRVISVTAPEHDADRCRQDIMSLVRLVRPVAVLALDDMALRVAGTGDGDLGAPLAGPTGRLTALALDRRMQLAGAELVGLAVPPTVPCRTRADVLGLSAPVLLRPALTVHEDAGRLMRPRSLRCLRPGALERAAEGWDERVSLLAQPLLRGHTELICGLATATGFDAWSAQTAVRMADPAGSCPSAYRSLTPDEDLLDRCEALLGEAGWRGPFALEFLRDHDGCPWFIGLHGCCPESLALPRHCGLEYPALAVADLLGVPVRVPPRRPCPDIVTCRHLGREILHVVRVLRGPPPGAVAFEWPSRRSAVRGVLSVGRGERWCNWRRSAPDVLLRGTVATLADAAAGRSGWS